MISCIFREFSRLSSAFFTAFIILCSRFVRHDLQNIWNLSLIRSQQVSLKSLKFCFGNFPYPYFSDPLFNRKSLFIESTRKESAWKLLIRSKTNDAKKSLSPPISPKRDGRLVTLRFSMFMDGLNSKSKSMCPSWLGMC